MISCSHWGMFEIPVPVGAPLPSQVNDYFRRVMTYPTFTVSVHPRVSWIAIGS